MKNKQPALLFYVKDWLSDEDLRRCSKAAKGVWVDMLCLMAGCEERGVLATGGIPWTDDEIAVAVGGAITENLLALNELLTKGVAHRRKSGAVFSPRLVRDEQIRKERIKAGQMGGNPRLKQSKSNGGRYVGESNLLNRMDNQQVNQINANANGVSSAVNGKESKGKPEPPVLTDESQIQALYDAYPKKVGRGQAVKAIRTALKKIAFTELLDAVQRYAKTRKGEDPQFTPNPATWFNGERWLDKVETTKPDLVEKALRMHAAGQDMPHGNL